MQTKGSDISNQSKWWATGGKGTAEWRRTAHESTDLRLLLGVKHKSLFGIFYSFLLKQQIIKYKVANYLKEAIELYNKLYSTNHAKKIRHSSSHLLPEKQPASEKQPIWATYNDKSHFNFYTSYTVPSCHTVRPKLI